ncbi:MAG: rhodanese-like domain-containing protein [Aureliella sp.]
MDTPIEINASETQKLLGQENVVLLDCREQNEYDTASIKGATLIPMSQWADAGAKLEEMKGKHIVVHCHHGMRSLRVAHWLRENGFPDAQSMAGGIDAWSTDIDPNVPRY